MQSHCKIVQSSLYLHMIYRNISERIIDASKRYPVVAIVGPHQSGKTTLVKQVFKKSAYVNLEEPDIRLFAQNDPRAFLNSYPDAVSIDEVQRVPDLLSYIQVIADRESTSGRFILTGSQNISLQEKISQTLAGRVALFSLLPFSLSELERNPLRFSDIHNFLFTGFYPPVYDKHYPVSEWYVNHIQTYIEKDVRQLLNITNLHTFTLFLKLCAGRTGQLLNYSALANEAGIAVNTVKSWLSLLQTSFIIFLLQPHHKNFNKRLVKMPKLYFYDVGLASALLGLTNSSQMVNHYLRGGLFENMIIAELIKSRFNYGLQSNLFFWRDKLGREIDVIVDSGDSLFPVEIKVGATIAEDFFKNLNYWRKLNGTSEKGGYLIYGGDQIQKRSGSTVLPWRQATDIFDFTKNHIN